VSGHAISGPERGAVTCDALCQDLQIAALMALDEEKPFGDEAAQGQSDGGSIDRRGPIDDAWLQRLARQWRKILDHGEDLPDGRGGDIIQAEFGPKMRIIEEFLGNRFRKDRPRKGGKSDHGNEGVAEEMASRHAGNNTFETSCLQNFLNES